MNSSLRGGIPDDPPLVLLINDEEWTARSMESVLKPEGYAVLLAYTGQQGLALAERTRPHLLLIDLQLPDLDGTDLCDRIRQLPTVGHNTPILLFSTGPVSRTQRLAGFRAGAWGFLSHPFDAQELMAQLEPLIMAKRGLDSVLEQSDLDPLTGVYSPQGLARRLQEMSGDMKRSRRPLSCVIVGPSNSRAASHTGGPADTQMAEGSGRPELGPEVTRELVSAIRSVARISDVVARINETDFLIVTPGTDEEGALRLAERVMEVVTDRSSKNPELREVDLYAGCCAVQESSAERLVAPEEFLEKAIKAMGSARNRLARNGGADRILPFDSN